MNISYSKMFVISTWLVTNVIKFYICNIEKCIIKSSFGEITIICMISILYALLYGILVIKLSTSNPRTNILITTSHLKSFMVCSRWKDTTYQLNMNGDVWIVLVNFDCRGLRQQNKALHQNRQSIASM